MTAVSFTSRIGELTAHRDQRTGRRWMLTGSAVLRPHQEQARGENQPGPRPRERFECRPGV
jgi:hypothetical protein